MRFSTLCLMLVLFLCLPVAVSAEGGKVNLNTASVQQLDSLPGIGPASVKALSSMDVHSVADLLCQFPRGYENRKEQNDQAVQDQNGFFPSGSIRLISGHHSSLKETVFLEK